MTTHNNLYTKGQFIEFCKELFGDYTLTSGKTNIQVVCPICKSFKGKSYDKQKLAIEINEHLTKCWVCGYKSKNLLHLIKKYKPDFLDAYIKNYKNSILLNDENIEEVLQQEIVTLPDEYILLVNNTSSEDAEIITALNYLKARGVTKEEDLWYWRFGISKASRGLLDRIIVPSYDEYGKLNYYSARTIRKNMVPKYINPYVNRENIIFNEVNISWNDELTIVEGVFDLIKCNDNATCILGSDLSANYELFQKIVLNKTAVVLGLDPDAKRKTIKFAERLYEFCVPVKIIEYTNMNDIGSMAKNEFNELLANAIVFDTEYMLKYKIQTMLS